MAAESLFDSQITEFETKAQSAGWAHGLAHPEDTEPLSGEWADSMTPNALYRLIGFTPEEWPEWVSEHICQQFEENAEQARYLAATED